VKEIVDLSKAWHLPSLSADDFYQAAQSRKPGATGRADSWRTSETQLLNHNMWELYAQNLRLLEDGKPWPEVFQLLIGALLPKKLNSTNPLDTRVIRLVSALVATCGKVRFRHTIGWQNEVFPPCMYGARQGCSAADLTYELGLFAEHSKKMQRPMIAILLNRAKCFDNLTINVQAPLCCALMAQTDAVMRFMTAMASFYNGGDGLITWLTVSRWVSPPIWQCNSLIQGEVFSVLAVQQLYSIWIKRCQNVSPSASVSTYLDDAIIRALFEHKEHVDTAWWEAIRIGNLANQPLNYDKCVVLASPGAPAKYAWDKYKDLHFADTAVALGVDVNFSRRRLLDTPTKRLKKQEGPVARLKSLPGPRNLKEMMASMQIVTGVVYGAEQS